MDLELPEDVKMLQSTIRKFREEKLMPREKEVMDLDKKGVIAFADTPDEWFHRGVKEAKELGIWYPELPQEDGGAGLSTLAHMVTIEELSNSISGVPLTSGLGGQMLLTCDPEVKDYYLPKLLNAEIRSCFAQTEPSGGSDVSSIQTVAEKQGNEFVINGRKMFISGADKADIAFVSSITDKAKGTHGGFSTFVIDTHQPGFKLIRRIYTMGGHGPWEILLENVRTPAKNMVGISGRGFVQNSRFLSGGRIGMGANFVGQSNRALNMAIDYAKKRVTFGEPLANRQAVQWMLVDSAIDLHAGRLMTYHAASWTDDHPEADNRLYTSMVRTFCSEMGLKVIDRAIQIHGGLGYSKDLPLELMWRRCRMMTIGEGPNEIQRFIIARQLFKG